VQLPDVHRRPRWSPLLLIAVAFVHLEAMAAEGEPPPPIVTGLPWTFDVKTYPYEWSRGPKTAKRETAWVWTSTKPLSVDERGKYFLRFQLVRHDFSGAPDAKVGLQQLFEAADPEVGLSYGWDYVAVDGATVWHLRAPCLLSRANFRKLVDNLVRVAMEGRKPGPYGEFQCPCGGSCRRK
jgi:hypothetical protein